MKTSPNKTHHLAMRVDDDTLSLLDSLCAACGGASRSRVLRRLLGYVGSDGPSGVVSPDGTPLDLNFRRNDFVGYFRRLDDALISSIADALRRR